MSFQVLVSIRHLRHPRHISRLCQREPKNARKKPLMPERVVIAACHSFPAARDSRPLRRSGR